MFYSSLDSPSRSFVGIIYDPEPKFYFPYGINLFNDSKDLRLLAVKTLYAIDYFHDKYNYSKFEDSSKFVNYKSMLWILEDYFRHGLIRLRLSKNSNNGIGKISWKRTISNRKLFTSILPSELITTSIVVLDEFIQEVHKQAIQISYEYMGWVTENKLNISSIYSNNDIKANIFKLNQLSRTIYNDKHRLLIKEIINVLSSYQELHGRVGIIYGTNYFHTVWEMMIHNHLSNFDKTNFLPTINWIDNNNHKRKKFTLVPDTLNKSKDGILVVDSKYYKYGITKDFLDLPNSSSIIKQLVYSNEIVKYENLLLDVNTPVYNIFILPSYLKDDEKYPYYQFGYAVTSWDKTPVFGFLMDTSYLIYNWGKQSDVIVTKSFHEIHNQLLRMVEL